MFERRGKNERRWRSCTCEVVSFLIKLNLFLLSNLCAFLVHERISHVCVFSCGSHWRYRSLLFRPCRRNWRRYDLCDLRTHIVLGTDVSCRSSVVVVFLEFIKFVAQQEECRKKWLGAENEAIRLKQDIAKITVPYRNLKLYIIWHD